MLNSRFLTLLSLLVLLSGCFRDSMKQEDKVSSQSVDFKVTTLTGTSQALYAAEEWSIPTAKVYDFRACIRNRVTNADMGPGHNFTVHRPDSTVFSATTDRLGCINWVENLNFNFTVDSKYIELQRVIRGSDIYDGTTNIRIGINPWAEFRGEVGPEVVFLDDQSLPASKMISGPDSALALTGLYQRASGQDLLIEDEPSTRIEQIGYQDKSKKVRVTIKIKPFIEPIDINGDNKTHNFKKGEFRVYPQLIANYLNESGQDKMILMPLLPEDLKIGRHGFLVYQKEVVLNREVTMGEIQLALKVEAINSPVYLTNYEGLHSVASFENIFGNHSPVQVEGVFSSKLFNYAEFIESTKNFETLRNEGIAFDLKPIRFKELDIRFVRIAPGETATRRTIMYRTQTEVVDTITGAPIRKQKFKIKKLTSHTTETRTNQRGELTDEISTDDDGLLKWTDEISHLYYVAEQFYYPEVEITHVNSAFNQKLKMAINPWNSGWTFGTDIRGREEFYERMNRQQKRDSMIMVDAFRYQTIRFRYEIDEYMTLNVKKAVVMALDPLTQRYTIEEGRQEGEPLRDGIYLVKIALVKYYIDPFQNGAMLYRDASDNTHRVTTVDDSDETRKGKYITVVKKLLRVQGGRITTPLEFSMRDLRMMSIRSNIMVQIETVDEQRLLRDNLIDRKLRELVDDYNAYNSGDMTEEEKEAFIRKNETLFIQERAKLVATMERELADLQAHRLKLADEEAERYRALNEFEDRVRSESSVHDRRVRRQELLTKSREDFENYVAEVRSNMDQMEKRFSEYWAEWEAEMDIPFKQRIGNGENESVYDYLASMQLFMRDFGLPEDISNEDLEAMRLNNYTQNPAAPFIDLDLYRNNSGLQKRTFIGPCTLVANDNMSELRPTDTIDEKYCDRIDCSQNLIDFGFHVDNSVFEQSAYHGAIKPFAMVHVDNIIDLYKEHEKNYYDGMKALSQIGNFIKTYNLEYVSLNDNKDTAGPKQFKNGCVVTSKASDPYNPNEYDHCYEDVTENVLKFSDFKAKLDSSNTEDLLKEFFKFKYYSEDHDPEPMTNTMPTLLEKTGDEIGNLTGEVQEELFGGTINDVVRTVFTDEENKARYLREFESGRLKAFDENYLNNFLRGGTEDLKLVEAVKLCGVLTKNIIKDLKEKDLFRKHEVVDPYYVRRFGNLTTRYEYKHDEIEAKIRKKCLKGIEFNQETGRVESPLISFDRRFHVIETGTYEHKEGKNLNLNVGYDFTVSDGLVTSVSSGMGISGSVNPLGVIPVVSNVASLNIAASKDVGQTSAVEIGRGSSVSSATFLVVQQATMEIELRKFERCFTASIMPNLFYDLRAEDLDLLEEKKISDSDVADSLSKGVMVCEGKYNSEPQKVIENYYYITQHFTAGDMLDEGNLLNHIWLLPLRGNDDFRNFMNLVNAKPMDMDGEVIREEDRHIYPNLRLRKNYSQILPSFPGMYTVQDIK